jgi:hypothetical protein
MPSDAIEAQMTGQLERIIRRVKQSMNYRGSYSTRDILGSLVARWIVSGEWERLKELPPEERHLGQSVRRFILDRFDQLRRRGQRTELDNISPGDDIAVPDDQTLVEMIELAELRQWMFERVAELEKDITDPRVRIPIQRPAQVGQILRLYLDGKTQREIATALGLSLGSVNKRIVEGTNYLVLLQTIEHGLA